MPLRRLLSLSSWCRSWPTSTPRRRGEPRPPIERRAGAGAGPLQPEYRGSGDRRARTATASAGRPCYDPDDVVLSRCRAPGRPRGQALHPACATPDLADRERRYRSTRGRRPDGHEAPSPDRCVAGPACASSAGGAHQRPPEHRPDPCRRQTRAGRPAGRWPPAQRRARSIAESACAVAAADPAGPGDAGGVCGGPRRALRPHRARPLLASAGTGLSARSCDPRRRGVRACLGWPSAQHDDRRTGVCPRLWHESLRTSARSTPISTGISIRPWSRARPG